jgi:hypothetical protein
MAIGGSNWTLNHKKGADLLGSAPFLSNEATINVRR